MMDVLMIAYVSIVLVAAVVLICRAGMLTPTTRASVRWQHLLLLAGLLFGLALALDGHAAAAKVCNAAGVLSWLLLAAPRWRDGPPSWTFRATDQKDSQ